MWASLPPGVYGQYSPALNVVKVSSVLQSSSVEVATAFLAHELTHLTDDLNGKLGDMVGGVCYEAEVRAFVNEANFWQMVVGPNGKTTQDAIEIQENAKMFAFVGNMRSVCARAVRQCAGDLLHCACIGNPVELTLAQRLGVQQGGATLISRGWFLRPSPATRSTPSTAHGLGAEQP